MRYPFDQVYTLQQATVFGVLPHAPHRYSVPPSHIACPPPSRSAFRSLLAALGLTAEELLADKDTLKRVLEVRRAGAGGGGTGRPCPLCAVGATTAE